MRRALAAAALGAFVLTACGAGEPAATTPLQREIIGFVDQLEQRHPNLYATTPRPRFRAEAAALAERAPGLSRDQLVAGLMRIAALPGPRNGHTAIYPFDPSHPRPLRVYPLRLYDFDDGLHVVAAERQELVGRRVSAIGDTPIAEVVALVRPLVPRDNESSRRWLIPEYVTTAEVLRGLGVVEGETARFAFADGGVAEFAPKPASAVASAHGSALAPLRTRGNPVWLRRLDRAQWLTTLQRGRAVYLGYRSAQDSTHETAERLLALARRPAVRRVVVDVRLNHGGDNTTYGPLVGVLSRPAVARKTVLLVGRETFSAAGNFAAEVARIPRVRVVGEPSGGAPNQWGDSYPIRLPLAGLNAYVATVYVQVVPGTATATVPDVRVPVRAADVLAARAAALARALALR